MQPFQQRVVDEKKALEDKLLKLKTFCENSTFSELDTDECNRLERQMFYMEGYVEVLDERITAFK